MFAVVKYGNQQYKVSPNMKLKIDKIDTEEGKTFKTDQVLLINDSKLELGTPFVSGAVCEAKVLKQAKMPKLRVFKMKSKKRYERTYGHRTAYTEIEIIKISKGTAKKADTKKEEPKAEVKEEAKAA